jgi:hypothetical protein
MTLEVLHSIIIGFCIGADLAIYQETQKKK